jgi:hypothetical protein
VAQDAVFVRELEYEISGATHKPFIHFYNDAASCYDGIPVFLANVASRKYGMHKKVCIVQGRTLAEAKFHLKTPLGISASSFTHSCLFPVFGAGQGSGNSPMYWLFISSTLFDIYDEKAHGATYKTPDRNGVTLTVKAIGFVHDVLNTTNSFQDNSITMDQLVVLATTDNQLWHDLLTACNQKQELSKCGYHAIAYSFTECGKPELIQLPEAHITIRDSGGQALAIQQWSNDAATSIWVPINVSLIKTNRGPYYKKNATILPRSLIAAISPAPKPKHSIGLSTVSASIMPYQLPISLSNNYIRSRQNSMQLWLLEVGIVSACLPLLYMGLNIWVGQVSSTCMTIKAMDKLRLS